MDTAWLHLAAQHGGYFRTTHAYDAGYGRYDLASAVREGQLLRLRRGVYVVWSEHQQRSEQDRHTVLCRAVLSQLGGNVALSHQSGSTAYGHDQWGWDTSVVHVTRLDGNAGRREAGVQHHVGRIRDCDLVERDGLLTLVEERVVVEAAVELGVERGLCIIDSSLRAGRVTKQSLVERAESIPEWPRSRRARLAVQLGDGAAATVGETRSRYLFWRAGLPSSELQWQVRDGSGQVVAITDFAWPDADHVGEFDGRRKYERDLRPGEEPADGVFREKRREDRIRDCGLGMSRWVWADLADATRAATARRVKEGIDQSRRRRARFAAVIA